MKKSVVLEIWGLGDGEVLDYSPHNMMPFGLLRGY